jgi:hypothetical protein
MPKCADCKDTGVIELLTSTKPCKCRMSPAQAAVPLSDEACFGTINGVTLSQPIFVDIETVPVKGMLDRSEELVAACAPGATFTLEVDHGGEISTFTGLSKSAVDFVHACLRAGWGPERVRDHLNEMVTAARVSERQKHLADLEAAGYPEHEIKAMAERIDERLFTVEDDGEAVKIIMEEVSGLILRKVIRGAIECLIPNVQKMPKAGFATGGVVSGHAFKQQCGFSFVPESCFGGFPHIPKPFESGPFAQSEDRAWRKGQAFKPQCGKAEFYKRMYGGKPDPTIDTSQIELRMLAHLQEHPNERFPHSPPASPDAG